MSDLIKRQAAIDVLATMQGLCATKEALIQNSKIWQQIKDLPSAQFEIIRCKDCAKREYCRTSTVWAVPPGDDWFCADAERRTD